MREVGEGKVNRKEWQENCEGNENNETKATSWPPNQSGGSQEATKKSLLLKSSKNTSLPWQRWIIRKMF